MNNYFETIKKLDELKNNEEKYEFELNMIGNIKVLLKILYEINNNIEMPIISPSSDGTIHMEWDIKDKYLDVNFIESDNFTFIKAFGGNLISGKVTVNNIKDLSNFIKWLVG